MKRHVPLAFAQDDGLFIWSLTRRRGLAPVPRRAGYRCRKAISGSGRSLTLQVKGCTAARRSRATEESPRGVAPCSRGMAPHEPGQRVVRATTERQRRRRAAATAEPTRGAASCSGHHGKAAPPGVRRVPRNSLAGRLLVRAEGLRANPDNELSGLPWEGTAARRAAGTAELTRGVASCSRGMAPREPGQRVVRATLGRHRRPACGGYRCIVARVFVGRRTCNFRAGGWRARRRGLRRLPCCARRLPLHFARRNYNSGASPCRARRPACGGYRGVHALTRAATAGAR